MRKLIAEGKPVPDTLYLMSETAVDGVIAKASAKVALCGQYDGNLSLFDDGEKQLLRVQSGLPFPKTKIAFFLHRRHILKTKIHGVQYHSLCCRPKKTLANATSVLTN